jgi:hypothetical protein
MQVVSLGELGAFGMPSLDREGNPLVLVFAARRFVLPAAGRPATEPLRRHDEQHPPPQEDTYWGEPGASSLRHEGQSAYTRRGTDVHVSGHAWAPEGRPITSMQLGVRVGACTRSALVFGDRFWWGDLVGLAMSKPLPFRSIPVVYERSFGGVAKQSSRRSDFCAHNPVGRGVYGSRAEAKDQPLPNFETIEAPITDVSSRPDPVGFGPIGRHWQPRAAWAGTYDDVWLETRAPLWPLDLDERFFSSAAPGLTAPGELRGGEPVILSGWSPDGDLRLALPTVRLLATSELEQGIDRRRMILDVIRIEPDEGTLTMIWRATVVLRGPPSSHHVTRVRALEPWEDAP